MRAGFRTAVAADTVALLAFVVVGVVDHGGGLALEPLARNAVPFLGAWFSAAVAVGTYRSGGLGRLLLTWVLAVPVGTVVRALWLGRSFDEAFVMFLVVGLGFTLLFLLAGRAALFGLTRARSRVVR